MWMCGTKDGSRLGQGRAGQNAVRFHHTSPVCGVSNLKLTNYFWDFSFSVFWWLLTLVNRNRGKCNCG